MRSVLTARELEVEAPVGGGFHGLSLEVPAGGAVGIAALGGADLSALLEVLAGLQPPASGEVAWSSTSSRDIDQATTPAERYRLERTARLEAGWFSPLYSLLQNRTLEQNIALPLEYHLGTAPELYQRVERLIRALGLTDHAGTRPAALSAGVRRRAQLARALVLEPPLLIVESPFWGVERESMGLMTAALEEHRRAGRGLLAASPDPLEIASLCTRLLVLFEGRVRGWLEGKDLEDGSLANPQAIIRKLELKPLQSGERAP